MTNGHDLANPLRHVEYRGQMRVYMEKDSYTVREWSKRTGISQELVRNKCRADDLAQGWSAVKASDGRYVITFKPAQSGKEQISGMLRDSLELLELLRNAAVSSATFEAPIRMSIEFAPTGVWAAHLLSPQDNPALAAIICGSGRTSLELAFLYVWYSELDSPVLTKVARPKHVTDSDWLQLRNLCIHCGKTLTSASQNFCTDQNLGCYKLHFDWIDGLKKSVSPSKISELMVQQLQQVVRQNIAIVLRSHSA
jgi:hypothetical protein